MNIDITALLSGGAPTRAGKGKLIGEDFALTLDDRLAQMGLLLPGLDVPAQLLSHEGYPLPQPVLPPVAEPGRVTTRWRRSESAPLPVMKARSGSFSR